MHEAAEYTRMETAAVASGLRRWLFSGKCQSESGAFCAWRDAESGELAFEYPEINGYLLTFAASLSDLTPGELAAARRGADWLVARLGCGDYSARAGWDGGAIYTFDLGMVASGLMSFGRLHGDAYVDAGLRVVQFLVSESDAAGKVPAVARGPVSAHMGWAAEGRAHLLKLVQCLLLGDELGVQGARDWAQTLIDEAAAFQQPDGRFLTDPLDETTMLHPHHYALEGLWIWGVATSEDWTLERARKGVRWAFRQQLESGGFPRFVSTADATDPGPEQADATAQAVRMAHLLGVEPNGLASAVERLAALTVGDELDRAVPYQPGTETRHENTWATLFAVQAAQLAVPEPREMTWRTLV